MAARYRTNQITGYYEVTLYTRLAAPRHAHRAQATATPKVVSLFTWPLIAVALCLMRNPGMRILGVYLLTWTVVPGMAASRLSVARLWALVTSERTAGASA